MNSLEKSAFKNAASKFASGVVIAITNYQDENNELSRPWHGMTISSFTTISMDPMIIMIAVSKKSKMHELLLQQENNCKFSISVLSENQKELSTHFAGQKIKEISNSLESNVIHLGNDYTFIRGCASYFICELEEAYSKGDHTLFFGQVVDAQTTEDNKKPLIYYSRSYNKLKTEE